MDNTSPRPFVFVLMPISPKFEDIYKLGIKPACEKAGAYAERVDEQIFHESILQRIYNQISKADVIVADMTGRNPNVFYEAGYAHALGKPVILLTKDADDIPFDLKHYPHIIYGGSIADLIPELEKRVAFAIEKPREAAERSGIDTYVDGKLLRSNPELIYHAKPENKSHFQIRFDFHNSADSRIKTEVFQIGFFVKNMQIVYEIRPEETLYYIGYLQPDGETSLFIGGDPFEVLPGAWVYAEPRFRIKKEHLINVGDVIELDLRIFSEDGPFDVPFRVHIKKQAG